MLRRRDVEPLVNRNVAQYALVAHIGPVSLAVTPNVGGIVMGIVAHVVGIAAEGRQGHTIAHVNLRLEVGVEVGVFLVLLHVDQSRRVADPQSLGHRLVFSVAVAACRQGGVEGRRRVEQLPLRRQQAVLLDTAEDAQVERHAVVEGFLRDVELGNVVSVAVGLDDCLVVGHAY